MLKKYFLTLLVCSLSLISRAQSTHFKRAQVGMEIHYFVVRHFAVGIGTEIWTTNQKNSFMMGVRWYGNDHVFVRFRGLIGANDAAIGLGYSKPLSQNLRFEGMGDFYFVGNLGLRFGLSYILK